jgi:hypothetical protein
VTQRALQDATDNRALADRLVEAIVQPRLGAEHTAFISSRDLFLLATGSRPRACGPEGGAITLDEYADRVRAGDP